MSQKNYYYDLPSDIINYIQDIIRADILDEKEENSFVFITQNQYDTYIKNMNKNKTGTSWIYVDCWGRKKMKRYKLYKAGKNLYFIDKNMMGDDVDIECIINK